MPDPLAVCLVLLGCFVVLVASSRVAQTTAPNAVPVSRCFSWNAKTYTGTFRVFTYRTTVEVPDTYYLESVGNRYKLDFSQTTTDDLSAAAGQKATFRACLRQPNTLVVLNYKFPPPGLSPKSYPTPPGTSFTIKAAVFILDVCGKVNINSVDSIKALLFNSARASASDQTLQDMYKGCSQGKVQLADLGAGSAVFGPVDVPCFGVDADGRPWDANCNNEQYQGWGDYAMQYAKDKWGYDSAAYTYSIFLMPDTPCQFVGMGEVGCALNDGSYCRVWEDCRYKQDTMLQSNLMHEMAHGFSLDHSNGEADEEYGDNSCPLGSGRAVCYNPAKLWALGWATPISTINFRMPGQGAQMNTWISMTLPPQISTSVNHVQVLLPDGAVFISYRTTDTLDQQLGDLGNKVSHQPLMHDARCMMHVCGCMMHDSP